MSVLHDAWAFLLKTIGMETIHTYRFTLKRTNSQTNNAIKKCGYRGFISTMLFMWQFTTYSEKNKEQEFYPKEPYPLTKEELEARAERDIKILAPKCKSKV